MISYSHFVASRLRLLMLVFGFTSYFAQAQVKQSTYNKSMELDLSGYSKKRQSKIDKNFLISEMPTRKSKVFKDKKKHELVIHYTDIEVPESGEDMFVWKYVNKHIAKTKAKFRESGFYQPNRKPIYYVKLSANKERYPHQLYFFTVQDGKLIYGTFEVKEDDYKKWNNESTEFISSLRFRVQPS